MKIAPGWLDFYTYVDVVVFFLREREIVWLMFLRKCVEYCACRKVISVGFEPTSLARSELESDALDHSAN